MSDLEEKIEKYLVYSYAYYLYDMQPVHDCVFDQLCVDLKGKIDGYDGKYRDLVDEDAMSAGTGFHIRREQYPQEIIDKAQEYLE